MPEPSDPSRHVHDMGGLAVLFVMATEQEYGPHLQRRITPLITGVGPVEAAAATAAALGEPRPAMAACPTSSSRSARPARARSIMPASTRSASVAYRDMDASPLGFDKGITPFLDEPAGHRRYRIACPMFRPRRSRPAARSSRGAGYDGDRCRHGRHGVLRRLPRRRAASACPMIGLRGISDGRSELTGLHDWTEYLHIIDEKLAARPWRSRPLRRAMTSALVPPATLAGRSTRITAS